VDNILSLVLRIVVWMLRTDLPTLIDSAGVLNTPALARVLGSTEISLICIERVIPKSYDKAHKYSRSDHDIFHDTLHSVFRA
jgi:hypothetical protein